MLMGTLVLDVYGVGRAGGAVPSPSTALLSQPPQAMVLLQNEHQALLLAAWKVLN